MSRRRVIVSGLVATVVATAAVALLAGNGAGAAGSALSRGAEGWLAARTYLEARGARVDLVDEAEPRPAGGVLVEVFPWQRADEARLAVVEAHLAAGGDLVLAYSGQGWRGSEDAAFDALGLSLTTTRGRAPAAPWRWREFVTAEWSLAPEAEPGAGPSSANPARPAPLQVPAPERLPAAPVDARVLYRAPGGAPAVFVVGRGRGRVFVVPAAAFANAGLAAGGNADLLEALRQALGDRWRFDEYAHGLRAATATAPSARVVELVAVHLAVLYLLGLLALARRFGPAWREPPVVAGSTATLLLGLGALHHRLGHQREAAELLVARRAEFDRLDARRLQR